METERAGQSDEKLIRALGVPTLTASIVNATVGAGIFVLPALVAAQLGPAAPIAFLICAVAMTLIVTSFAMAGSRVSLTGGLYAYVEVAFGRYVGFLAGVLLWLTNVLAVAGVASALVASVALVIPAVQSGLGRFFLLVLIFLALAIINIRGVRAGAGTVASLTIAKLLPLLLFISVGLFFVRTEAISWSTWPDSTSVGQTVLLLIFAFMGVELALVPSGEVKNPARTVPRSIFLALAITTLLYIAIQLVAQGVLGSELANFTDAPLAEAASRFLGATGKSIILAGAAISAFGYVSGDILGSPRTLYAFGRSGVLPGKMAAVHPKFHTPHIAIGVHAIIAGALAVSSTFQYLAILSNIAALLLYLFCCAATLELIRRNVRADGPPFSIRRVIILPILAVAFLLWILPHPTLIRFAVAGLVLAAAWLIGDKIVPIIAVAVVIWILSHATASEFAVAGMVLVIASALYCLRRVPYVGRHWRGEFSLPKSYWINGVLVFGLGCNFVLLLATTVTAALFLSAGNPALATFAIVLELALNISAYVWALVGIWRSAKKYEGPRIWSILARVAVALGILVTLGRLGQDVQFLEKVRATIHW
jgi:amino acid transporter